MSGVQNFHLGESVADPVSANYNQGHIDSTQEAFYTADPEMPLSASRGLRFTQPAIDDPTNLENMVAQIPGSTRWTCLVCNQGSWKGKNEAKRHASSKHLQPVECPMVEMGYCVQNHAGFRRSDHLQDHWSKKHPLLPRELCRDSLLALNRGNNAPNATIRWILDDPYLAQGSQCQDPDDRKYQPPVSQLEYNDQTGHDLHIGTNLGHNHNVEDVYDHTGNTVHITQNNSGFGFQGGASGPSLSLNTYLDDQNLYDTSDEHIAGPEETIHFDSMSGHANSHRNDPREGISDVAESAGIYENKIHIPFIDFQAGNEDINFEET
ncbi:hypothetical protein EDC01DRAFT_635298 [Geopyxis carbonaria]|nr:hypothetical protein EDC01DRAFT_635298 [Geopyxis carbonaria]